MPGADGDALRSQRRSHGWDVPEMARRLRRAAGHDPLPEHGDLVRMIRRWERGTYRLSERYELLYAAALGVRPDDLRRPGGASRQPEPPQGPHAPGVIGGDRRGTACGPGGPARL